MAARLRGQRRPWEDAAALRPFFLGPFFLHDQNGQRDACNEDEYDDNDHDDKQRTQGIATAGV